MSKPTHHCFGNCTVSHCLICERISSILNEAKNFQCGEPLINRIANAEVEAEAQLKAEAEARERANLQCAFNPALRNW